MVLVGIGIIGSGHLDVRNELATCVRGRGLVRSDHSRQCTWDRVDSDWSPQPAKKLSNRETRQLTPQLPETYFEEAELLRLKMVDVPDDLRRIVNAPHRSFEVDRHVLENVVPGGRHPEVEWHVRRLYDVLNHWRLWGPSPRVKWEMGSVRWEVYTPVGNDSWICSILGSEGKCGTHNIITVYAMSRQTVKNRYCGDERTGRLGYLQRRGEE